MPILKNKRYEKFAQGIAKGLNQSEAYRLAGFKAKGENIRKNAARLTTNADVQSRIFELSKKAESKAIADVAEIQAFLTSVMRGEVTETRIYGKDADQFELEPQINDRIKAAETLARAKGMFNRDSEDNGDFDMWQQQIEEAASTYGPS